MQTKGLLTASDTLTEDRGRSQKCTCSLCQLPNASVRRWDALPDNETWLADFSPYYGQNLVVTRAVTISLPKYVVFSNYLVCSENYVVPSPQNIILWDYRGSRDSFISFCCCFHVFIVSTGAVPGSAPNLVSVYYTDVKRQRGSVKETNCLLAPCTSAETQNELEGDSHSSLENIFSKRLCFSELMA